MSSLGRPPLIWLAHNSGARAHVSGVAAAAAAALSSAAVLVIENRVTKEQKKERKRLTADKVVLVLHVVNEQYRTLTRQDRVRK